MGKLVRIGDAAFDLDKVVGVEGDRVIFADGKEIRVSKRTKEALLGVLPAVEAPRREPSPKGLRLP